MLRLYGSGHLRDCLLAQLLGPDILIACHCQYEMQFLLFQPYSQATVIAVDFVPGTLAMPVDLASSTSFDKYQILRCLFTMLCKKK